MISLQHRRLAWLIALFVVVGVALFSYTSARRYIESEAAVHRTLDVRDAIAGTLSLLKDAETGQRGYLLTSNPAFLGPHEKALREIDVALGRLSELTADDTAQAVSAMEIHRLARAKLSELAETIELHRSGHADEAIAAVREGKGRRFMLALRAETARMLEREAERLGAREGQARAGQRSALLTLGGALALVVAIVLAGFASIRQDVEDVRLANERLEQSAGTLRSVTDNAVDLIRIIDAQAQCVYASPSSQALLGYEPDELVQMKPLSLHPEDVRGAWNLAEGARTTGQQSPPLVHRLRRKDGAFRWFETRIQPHPDTAGGSRSHLASRDITAQKEAEDAQRRSEKELAENEQRLRVLSEASFEGLAITKGGVVVDVNANFARWLGREREELVGIDGITLFAPEDREHVARTSGAEPVYEARLVRRDGSVFPVEVRGREAQLHGETVRIAVVRDVTERKAREVEVASQAELLRALSLRDELTGLYNRRGFLEHGRQLLRGLMRSQRSASLFFADLDGLKAINDERGHEAGDRAIAAAGQVLSAVFRESDIVARLGGDEFAMLALDCDATQVPIVQERLRAAVGAFNASTLEPFLLSMSLGAASYDPSEPVELERLMETADQRMYEQKRTSAMPRRSLRQASG